MKAEQFTDRSGVKKGFPLIRGKHGTTRLMETLLKFLILTVNVYVEKIVKNHLWTDMTILKERGYLATKNNINFL